MEMKTDGFYTVIQSREPEEGRFVSRIRLRREHWIYQAHFPAMPVTPGVCVLQLIGELLAARWGRRLQPAYGKNIKFLRLINPEEYPEIEVDLLCEVSGTTLKVQSTVRLQEIIFVKASLVYEAEQKVCTLK